MNSSWKTSLFGLMAGVGAGITGAYLIKPDALASFPHWLPGVGVLLTSIGTTCLGLAARDNNKSSEQVGAGGPSPISIKTLPLLALAAVLSFGTVGCQAPHQRIEYNLAAAPVISLDHARQAWVDYVRQFNPSPAVIARVEVLYEKARAAAIANIDAEQILAGLSGSETNLTARIQQTATSRAAQNALADFVSLLQQLGVKL